MTRRTRTALRVEPLGDRLAPATLTFTDVDGDDVKITTTGPGTLTLGANVIVNAGQLERLDLTSAAFQGANVSIVATRAPVAGGDGRVNVGKIDATGRDLGAVTIDGDLVQFLAGSDSADPTKGVASLTVASLGRLALTTGATACEARVDGRLGVLAVAGDVVKAAVQADSLGTIKISGSLFGGPNPDQGLIFTPFSIDRVIVGGDLVGAEANASGSIEARGSIGPVTIGGSLRGGSNSTVSGDPEFNSGALIARGTIGPVKIGGDLRGGPGFRAGAIVANNGIAGVTIGGSLVGGSEANAGLISTNGPLGPVKIGGNIKAGTAGGSGRIFAQGHLASITVGGSLLGGLIQGGAAMGPVKIGGDIVGGDRDESGSVFCPISLASLTVGGSLRAGTAIRTGAIVSSGPIGAVRIGHDLVGGALSGAGVTGAALGCIIGQRIGRVFIGGSLLAGFQTNGATLEDSGAIRAENDIGEIVVKGSIVGNTTLPVFITAGRATPGTLGFVAIKSLTVGGRVERTQIIAGVTKDAAMTPVNGDAQISAISVGGDWVSSRVTAGTQPGVDRIYGTADDSFQGGGVGTAVSRIASITIKGQVVGSVDPAESFRFMAQKIGSFRVGGTAFPLTAGADNFSVGTTPGNVRIFDGS
jgi:hypothetical protein